MSYYWIPKADKQKPWGKCHHCPLGSKKKTFGSYLFFLEYSQSFWYGEKRQLTDVKCDILGKKKKAAQNSSLKVPLYKSNNLINDYFPIQYVLCPQINICYTYTCNVVMILVILQVFYKISQCDKPLK